MEKATEQEIIPITLSDKLKDFLADELERNIRNKPAGIEQAIPQFKFIKSVLQKVKNKSEAVMLFSARECATIEGWLMASLEMTENTRFKKIHDIVHSAFKEWEKKNILD